MNPFKSKSHEPLKLVELLEGLERDENASERIKRHFDKKVSVPTLSASAMGMVSFPGVNQLSQLMATQSVEFSLARAAEQHAMQQQQRQQGIQNAFGESPFARYIHGMFD